MQQSTAATKCKEMKINQVTETEYIMSTASHTHRNNFIRKSILAQMSTKVCVEYTTIIKTDYLHETLLYLFLWKLVQKHTKMLSIRALALFLRILIAELN